MKIYFNNIKCCCFKRKVRKLFEEAYKSLNTDIEVDVGLTFVTDEEIRALNVKHRDVNRVTDVLSFPMLELDKNSIEEYRDEIDEETNTLSLGDIVISKSVAKRQAKEYKHSLMRELCFLALHGFLHLLGYDHIEKEDEEKMQSFAEEILKNNKLERK